MQQETERLLACQFEEKKPDANGERSRVQRSTARNSWSQHRETWRALANFNKAHTKREGLGGAMRLTHGIALVVSRGKL